MEGERASARPARTDGGEGARAPSHDIWIIFFPCDDERQRNMSKCSVQSVRCGAQGGVGEQKTTNTHYEKHTAGKHMEARVLHAGDIAGRVRVCSTRPAVEDLPSRPTPNLCGDCGMQALIDRLRCNRAPSSRNLFGECAKNGDGARIWSAVGTPYERRVFNILSL